MDQYINTFLIVSELMFSPNPRLSNLPLTSFKLNYYLSQNKKKNNRDNIFQQSYSPTIRNQSSHLNNKQQNRYQYQPSDFMNPTQQVRQPNQSCSPLSKPMILNNHSTISLNACNPPDNMNDSLDVLVTDRQSHRERSLPVSPVAQHKISQFPNYSNKYPLTIHGARNQQDNSLAELQIPNECMNNDSCISDLSPRHILSPRNNIQYYNQPKTQIQPKNRRVNWRLPYEGTQPTPIYQRSIDKSFKEISHELSKITYELNRNSSKLQQMSKLYPHPIKKVSAQESLKRANLKYAERTDENTNEKGLRCRPVVEYQDAEYRDPRILMWQPLHQQKIIYQ